MGRGDSARGLSLTEWATLAVIVGLLASIAAPGVQVALRGRAHQQLVAELDTLHEALAAYRRDHGRFPTPLDLQGYAPLTTEGYFNEGASLNARIVGGKPIFQTITADGNQYFSIVRLQADPDFVVFTGRIESLQDLFPGSWDGVYVVRDGGLVSTNGGTW